MAIFLAQHGKSASKDVDPERGLTQQGRAEVEGIARRLADAGVGVEAIWHSGKTRAEQTAEIFARALQPKRGVAAREGIDPMDAVEPLADRLPVDRDTLIVGHLPFMQRLVSVLVVGDADVPVIDFQNGGVVCLDWNAQAHRWIVRWTAFPSP